MFAATEKLCHVGFRRTIFATLYLIVIFATACIATAVLSDRTDALNVPQKMNFQGRLTNSAGNVLPNGTYNMRLKLYNAATGGTVQWSEDRLVSASTGVVVNNGLFSIRLGDVSPFNYDIFAMPLLNNESLHLEIELPTPASATSSSPVWTEGAMTPRNQIATSAYAFLSDYSIDSARVGGIEAADLAKLNNNNAFIGRASFQSSANDVDTFKIANSSGAALLTADTTNKRITIGDSSANTTFLVLSNYSQSGDPANGSNGSIYYNSSSGKFRCFEAGAWKDCITTASGGGSGTTVRQTSNIQASLTANTLTDTQLQFTATANVPYRFQAFIMYNSAAATTGSRWTMTGPTLGSLALRSSYTLSASNVSATNETINYVNAYNTPTSSSAASLTSGNIALLNGRITTTATGVVKVQFASEVAASGITILAGSSLTFSVDQ